MNMIRYILVPLCMSLFINSAEKPALQQMAEKSIFQKQFQDKSETTLTTMVNILHSNNINPNNKRILNICYGTEVLSPYLEQKALSVHSYNKKGNQEFPVANSQDLAIGIFSLDLIKDKQKALASIYRSLKSGGEFFFTMVTSSNPLPLNVVVGREIISSSIIAPTVTWLSSQLTNSESISVNDPYLSDKELQNLIRETGFTIQKYEPQQYSFIFSTDKDIEDVYRPIFMNLEIVQLADSFFNKIPLLIRPEYFTIEHHIKEFFNKIITRMKKSENGEFIDTITTTVIHAKKP